MRNSVFSTVRVLVMTLVLTVGFAGPGAASDLELSFEAALEIMAQKNEALKAAREEKSAREFETKAAEGLYYPKVSAGGRYTRIDDPVVLDLNQVRDVILKLHDPTGLGGLSNAIPPFTMDVQDDDFIKGDLSASWAVFTGGRITAANHLAQARETEAGEKFRQTRGTLVADMVKRYYGLRLYDAVVRLRQDYLNGVEKHLSRARALEENGIISRAERLHAQVAVTEARRELKSAKRDREVIRAALANILSMDRDAVDTVTPVSPLFLVRTLPDLEQFLILADTQNPLLGQVRAKKDMAREGLAYEKGFLWPEVYLFGKYELNKDDLTVLEPEWAAGVGVNLPLFEGMARMNTIEAAGKTLNQVEYIEKKAARDIATLTEKKYNAVMKYLEEYDALKDTIALAKEALRVRTRSFEEGLSTSLDVVDAQLTLSGARIKQLTSVYQFDTALAELLEAAGAGAEFVNYNRELIAEEIL